MAITPKYQTYLNSPRWKAKRFRVFIRAKFLCEKCKRKRATQVHHKTYARIFKEPLSDLVAVCAPCHRKIHGIREKPKKRRFGKLGKVRARIIG
jgi:5-methylcytosine-specific restriction endonuclease McrA